jgi:acetylornithine/succinyldiaminopimelate/putrescine aminotransferase
VPGFVHVPVGDLAAFERALTPDVALAIVELVQGEGGVLPLQREYVAAMRALCRERGVLFAIDEVQTGIGRTGAWFAHSDLCLEPDLVCLAKGLAGGVPIGALVMRPELAKLPAGSHGSTFGGNPLACAAANAVLDVLERDGLVERAHTNGARLLARLTEHLASHPSVRAIRGRGLMIGVELRVRSAPVQQRLQERGFLVLGAGPNVVRLLPPLVSTWDELAELADVLCEEIVREAVGRATTDSEARP